MSEKKEVALEDGGLFVSILTRPNSKISAERAARWSKSLVKESKRIVDDLESEVDAVEEKIENMMDISTSNDLQSANRVGEFNSADYARKLHAFEYDLALAEEKLSVARSVHGKYC